MIHQADKVCPRRLNWTRLSLLIVSIGLALLIAANGHLVYVSWRSQPDCVPHAKQTGETGTYRAARSAC